MPARLNSPEPNVAKNAVVKAQSIITEIKTMILNGATNDEIKAKIIDYCKTNYTSINSRKVMYKNLVNSANSLKYQLNYNQKIIDTTFINQVVHQYGLGTGASVKNDTITIDLNAIYNEYLNKRIDARAVVDQFRGKITNTKLGNVLIKDYQNKVEDQVNLIAKHSATYVSDTGRKMSIRNRVESAIRYQANMGDLEKMKNSGVRFVWTSSHANASPRCRDHQGKLYSLDGTSGEINGIKYTPLDDVLKLNGYNSIINGYNCRHYLIEYEKGQPAPRDFTEKEIEKEYAIDKTQRAYENRIRDLKMREACYRAKAENETDTVLKARLEKKADAFKAKYTGLYKNYDSFSRQAGRATYRWRTEIYDSEV